MKSISRAPVTKFSDAMDVAQTQITRWIEWWLIIVITDMNLNEIYCQHTLSQDDFMDDVAKIAGEEREER